jgi:hypothetical protein
MHRRRFLQSSSAAGVTALLSSGRLLAGNSEAINADVQALSGAGEQLTLPRLAVQELAEAMRGGLLLPGMEGYESARMVMNRSIDKHPALIAQCTGVVDVQSAVDFARSNGVLVAVKGGGHSFSGKGTCEGGLLIDLSPLRGTRVDPTKHTAWVEGGSLLGQMDHEAMAFGLVTTAGTVSHTGVGGLTLGGGFGRLARRFGLALDNVKSVEIVTADGQFRRASAEENPDLYWGVRGGGGNFGVVTAFEFQLHPMDRTVIGGSMIFPQARAKEILDFYGDYTAQAPDEMYLDAAIISPPGGGDPFFMLNMCYSGDRRKADAVMAPLNKLGTPLVNGIKATDYVALQRASDNSDPRGKGEYQKSGFVRELTPDLINAVVDGFEPDPGRSTILFFQHSGGAIGRVPTDATAFAHRYSRYNLFTSVGWSVGSDSSPHVRRVKEYWAGIEPHTHGFYTNDAYDQSQELVNRNYQGNYGRLVEVKNRYDSGNLFRVNANVAPTA